MAQMSAKFRRGWVTQRLLDSQANGTTLKDEIQSQLSDADGGITGGQVISSTSANGHSVGFSEPGRGGPGPAGSVELAQEMLERYDRAVEDLGGTPTDNEIADQMKKDLIPIRTIRPDWNHLQK